ncbi:hypothetical protein ACSQ67_020243 [Phaseolus vulgaris]
MCFGVARVLLCGFPGIHRYQFEVGTGKQKSPKSATGAHSSAHNREPQPPPTTHSPLLSTVAEMLQLMGLANKADYLPFLRWFHFQNVEKRFKKSISKRYDTIFNKIIHENRNNKDHRHAVWRDRLLNGNSGVVAVEFVESSRGVGEGERGIGEISVREASSSLLSTFL